MYARWSSMRLILNIMTVKPIGNDQHQGKITPRKGARSTYCDVSLSHAGMRPFPRSLWGQGDVMENPLVRLHSQCTGDVQMAKVVIVGHNYKTAG